MSECGDFAVIDDDEGGEVLACFLGHGHSGMHHGVSEMPDDLLVFAWADGSDSLFLLQSEGVH